MGLFDRLRSKAPDRSFTPQEAASGVLLCVIASDGEISDDEIETFLLIANRHPLFRDQPAVEFNPMIRGMRSLISGRGWQEIIDKCAADCPDELRATLFCLAVDFVLADGSVPRAEEQLISHLQSALHMKDDYARSVVDVLATKNAISL